jgi:long-chain acyl-CoA synthetase
MIDGFVKRLLSDWDGRPVLVELDRTGRARPIDAAGMLAMNADCKRLLGSAGAVAGSSALLVLDNSADFMHIFLALLDMRVLVVPAKPEYRSVELDEIFANSRPRIVIAEERCLDTLQPYIGRQGLILRNEPGRFRMEQTAGQGAHEPIELPKEIVSVNYTYRGYGYPLGALITLEQYVEGGRLIAEATHIEKGDRLMTILPLSHIFTLVGCMFMPLVQRITNFIQPGLNPRHIFEAIRNNGITVMLGIPELFALLARIKPSGLELSTLRRLISGGSRLLPADHALIERSLQAVHMHGYGLTEFAPLTANIWGEQRATLGPYCPGIQGRISNGEIQVRTPHLARGYLLRSRESAESLADGWFKTGDAARMDSGHLVFETEIKKTAKVNGLMVDLEEVARTIRELDGIGGADVSRQNNSLLATIEPAGHQADAWRIDPVRASVQLRELLDRRIASYKIPKRIRLEGDTNENSFH